MPQSYRPLGRRRSNDDSAFEIQLQEFSRSGFGSSFEMGGDDLSLQRSLIDYKTQQTEYDAGSSNLKGSSKFTDITSLRDGASDQLMDDHRSRGKPTKGSWFSTTVSRFTGWRGGLRLNAMLVTSVLLLNVVLTIYATASFETVNGITTVFEGSCSSVKKTDSWLHIVINALSTAMLAASNYAMQCLVSPTREEIDKAHSQGIWVDIGVPNIRNLKRISWTNVIMWWLFAISSLPLHLIYNTAVFSTFTHNEFLTVSVTKDFLAGKPFSDGMDDFPYDMLVHKTAYHWATYRPMIETLQKDIDKLERLSNQECMNAYGTQYIGNRRNLVLVSSMSYNDSSVTNVDIQQLRGINEPGNDPLSWICQGFPGYGDLPGGMVPPACNVDDVIGRAEQWEALERPNDYCLSERVDEKCLLQFSFLIMMIVILCNVIKLGCIIFMLMKLSSETLVTVGDAIASFLDNPDQTTKGKCIYSKDTFVKEKAKAFSVSEIPMPWRPKAVYWREASSLRRWLVCIALCSATLIVTGCLLGLGIKNIQTTSASSITLKQLWRLGFGTINSQSMINMNLYGTTDSTLLGNVLLANLPQAILSFLYLMYNGIYTCMLLADEWSRYAIRRRTLRVTSPRGQHRSTYWLQMPYTFGIPLLLLSGLMHWLISQSIFLARVHVQAYNGGVPPYSHDISTLGYSCIAIIFTIAVGGVMILTLIGIGFRRYKGDIPLASSCSAAISAACHPPPGDVGASLLPLKWGVVEGEDNTVGHCTFTSYEVTAPVNEHLYAGREKKEK